MQNVDMKIEGNKLTIVVDLSKSQGKSKSGKSEIVASTGGNVTLTDGKTKLGLNVYR